MLNESTAHYREMIEDATRVMSVHFNKAIHFSEMIQLSEPDRRNVVLRLLIDNPTTEMPKSLILKKTAIDKKKFDTSNDSETEIEQLSRFARDWAGIEFLEKIGSTHAPRFYAGSMEHQYILIEDLGTSHPSLVGPLTLRASFENAQAAEIALAAYMTRLGKMHADTMGKVSLFNSILKRIYPQAKRVHYIPQPDESKILEQLKLLTGDESQELKKEIQDIIEFATSPSDFNVLVHGDICPDNVYYQESEIRLIDFEFCDYGNALIDGVYLRMSMPSCWCSKAVPNTVLNHMELIYRTELKKAVLLAGDDYIYDKQLVFACAYWVIKALQSLHEMKLIENEWICGSGPVDADSEWKPEENAFRPRILSRLGAFISCATKAGHLPELCGASIRLLAYLKKNWPETKDIDLYPVFRDEK